MQWDGVFVSNVNKNDSYMDILNWYRNLYHAEPLITERGIMANAINDLFMSLKDSDKKQIPKTPLIWENKHYFSPTPNDDWGYECPCCGNQEIDYP